MCSLYFFLEFLSLILTDLNQLFPKSKLCKSYKVWPHFLKNLWIDWNEIEEPMKLSAKEYIIQKYINWKGEVKTWEKVQHEGWVHIRCLSLSWPRWSAPGSGGCGSRVSAPEPDAAESWEHSVNLSELKLLQIKLSIHLNCWCIKLSNWSEASRNQ